MRTRWYQWLPDGFDPIVRWYVDPSMGAWSIQHAKDLYPGAGRLGFHLSPEDLMDERDQFTGEENDV